MIFTSPLLHKHAKIFILFGFALAVLLLGAILRGTHRRFSGLQDAGYNNSLINNSATESRRDTRRKEYMYRLLTNTTRSLIQMEIKARRLEENMRRIRERTADLLWKNKDKALWHILFKNISRHIAIRHEFHQHASLKRIMQDSHKHVHRRRKRRVNVW